MDDKNVFKVKLGDPVQLQFVPDDGRERLSAKIIGHAPNKSLIISAPVGSTGKLALLRENQPFVIRMLQGNRIYGFESEILKYYTLPYPHVHLSHPKEVESIVVRGARRIDTTNLVVSVQFDAQKTPVSATLRNISMSGALMQCKQALGKLDDKISFSIELEISGMQKYLRINAIIRNLSTPEDRKDDADKNFRHGLQFLELDEDQRLYITAYVHEQTIKQLED